MTGQGIDIGNPRKRRVRLAILDNMETMEKQDGIDTVVTNQIYVICYINWLLGNACLQDFLQ